MGNRDRAELDAVRKEQLASQVLAVIAADWSRPTLEETEYILERAGSQARDAVTLEATKQVPEQP